MNCSYLVAVCSAITRYINLATKYVPTTFPGHSAPIRSFSRGACSLLPQAGGRAQLQRAGQIHMCFWTVYLVGLQLEEWPLFGQPILMMEVRNSQRASLLKASCNFLTQMVFSFYVGFILPYNILSCLGTPPALCSHTVHSAINHVLPGGCLLLLS